jgi:hypothetical protein
MSFCESPITYRSFFAILRKRLSWPDFGATLAQLASLTPAIAVGDDRRDTIARGSAGFQGPSLVNSELWTFGVALLSLRNVATPMELINRKPIDEPFARRILTSKTSLFGSALFLVPLFLFFLGLVLAVEAYRFGFEHPSSTAGRSG